LFTKDQENLFGNMLGKNVLAINVLHDHFGDLVEKVGECLIKEGALTIVEIIRRTRLSFQQVRNALIVLIQHNMVFFYEKEERELKLKKASLIDEEEGNKKSKMIDSLMSEKSKKSNRKTKNKGNLNESNMILSASNKSELPDLHFHRKNNLETIFYYEITVEQVLMRLKCAKFIALIRDRIGIYGELIMEELLEHGRLTSEDIIETVSQKLYQEKEEQLEGNRIEDFNSDYSTLDVYKKNAKKALDLMVKDRFLKRVEKFISNEPNKSENTSQTAKDVALEGINLTREKLEKGIKRKATDEKETENSKQKKRRKTVLRDSDDEDVKKIDDKRDNVEKNLETNVFESNNASKTEEPILWMVNFDQFIRTFRNEAISKYVSERINPTAAFIFKAILKLTAPYEKTKNDQISKIVNFDEIFRVIQADDEYQTSQRNVEKYLDIMSQENTQILQKMSSSNGGGSYAINLSGIVERLKRQYAESIIEQKHGQIGCRIFRMLLMKKMLEQKQIAEFAMIPMHEARTLLYKMLEDEVVELQEVPKHSDYAPSRTFFLWNVKLNLVYEKLTSNMYQTCHKLRLRLTKEQEDALNATGGGFLTSTSNLSKEQQALINRLEKAEDRLESSIIHLNTLLMFFEDF
jgi:DNA-directed RNA polymerase III subunit RPC3